MEEKMDKAEQLHNDLTTQRITRRKPFASHPQV
jgi:hypothetical protein